MKLLDGKSGEETGAPLQGAEGPQGSQGTEGVRRTGGRSFGMGGVCWDTGGLARPPQFTSCSALGPLR